jgi:hypothetical protein
VPRRGPISRGQLCPEPCGGGQETLPNGWTLRLEYMHNLAQTNAVHLNDHLLGYIPARDNAPTWVSVALPVPADLLRPGYNELAVEVSRLSPDYQQSDFTWGDVQFRRIRLERR